MAAGKKTGWSKQVIWLDFSHNDRALIRQQYDEGTADIRTLVLKCLDAGHKVSFSQRADNDVYVLSLTLKGASGPYKGKTYLLQHVDLDVCMTAALFVLDVMLEAGSLPTTHDDLVPNW